jgi:hypothetical protein
MSNSRGGQVRSSEDILRKQERAKGLDQSGKSIKPTFEKGEEIERRTNSRKTEIDW